MKYCKSPDAWIIVISFIASVFFVAYRGHDYNWDLLNYHYFEGYSYLHGREAIDLAPAGLQTYLHPAINVIAYLAFSKLPFPLAAWAILAVQFLSVPAIILISREIGAHMGVTPTSATRYLALVLCLTSPLWISELGTSFFSSSTAPLVLWGLYFLLKSKGNRHISWFLAGILLGLSVGLKLTNALFAISAIIATFFLLKDLSKNRASSFLSFALGGLSGALLTAQWYWYLWVTWHNPVFPLYNGIFKSDFYIPENFRDLRWVFNSFWDFLAFIVQASHNTSKTSEVAFADARLLIILLLLLSVVIAQKVTSIGRPAASLIAFFLSGTALWAASVAYQRYLIPIEMLMGLIIWIFIVRLVSSEKKRLIAMSLILLFSILTIRIPDWGHVKNSDHTSSPFDISIPARFVKTPANYLVIGRPISYLLPSLHHNSHFYGVNFSDRMDELIRERLKADPNTPVRLLYDISDGKNVRELVTAFNIPSPHQFDCADFRSDKGRYAICEIVKHSANVESPIMNVVYHDGVRGTTTNGVMWESGLSTIEDWGRWSNGSIIEWGLPRCLPKGELTIMLEATAFGPNVEKPFILVLGDQKTAFYLKEEASTTSISVDNRGDCVESFGIQIPHAISPRDLDLGNDDRKLGMGVRKVTVSAK